MATCPGVPGKKHGADITRRHCQSPNCRWYKCTDCEIVFDDNHPGRYYIDTTK